jgi:hypothetical protein
VTSGDFDADGCSDIAVSAHNRSTRGAVEIWSGCNEVPSLDPHAGDYLNRLRDNLQIIPEIPVLRQVQQLIGEVRYANFGYDVHSGDYNGDGFDDLAVSSPTETVLAVNNGRVRVYLGSEDGLAAEPWLIIDGKVIEENGDVHAEANMRFGWRMATGDVNADGCDDLLIGAPYYNGSHGAVILHLSVASGEFPSGCALSPDPAVMVVEAVEDERRAGYLGWELALGDLDGDCVLDLVSSQWNSAAEHASASGAGSVFFISGDQGWSPDSPIRLRRDAARVTAYGDRWDNLGWNMDTGDIDNDGITDLIVGARYGDEQGVFPNAGEVQIFRGLAPPGCDGVPFGEPALSEPITLSNARRYGDLFGQKVAVVPDVDGDGVVDLVVYAPRGPGGDIEDETNHVGRAYVFSGGTTEWTFEDGAPVDIPAPAASDYYGWTVQRVGDFNDDGYDDFVIGAPLYDRDSVGTTWGEYTEVHGSAGIAYLHYGGSDGLRSTPDLAFRDHAQHTSDDYFGYAVGAAGDFNNDGFDDIAISAMLEDNQGSRPCAPCRSNGSSNIGSVYVYLGGASRGGRYMGDPMDLPRESEPDFLICGADVANWNLGREIHGGFDHNGDGYDDLALSNSTWASNRGRVDVVHGRDAGQEMTIVCAGESSEIARGATAGDRVGLRMTSMDLNGDACDDLLIGAPTYDVEGRVDTGAVLVHLGWGGPGCPTTASVVEWAPARAYDNMGFDLVEADVNGDGVTELIVSSQGLSGGSNVSAALIFEGQRLRDAFSVVGPGQSSMLMEITQLLSIMTNPAGRSGSEWGSSMVNLGDVDGDGTDDLLVGARYSRHSSRNGDDLVGGAYLYLGSEDPNALIDADGFIGGETEFPHGLMGERVAGGVVGPDGPAVILVGAPFSEWEGPGFGELGAVYLGIIEP